MSEQTEHTPAPAPAHLHWEKAREVLRHVWNHEMVAIGALNALEACVVRPAPPTIDRAALMALLVGDAPGANFERKQRLADRILALVRPADAVRPTPEEERRAQAWERAYTETDLIARVGFGALADLRRQGVDPKLIVPALYAHLDRFLAAVQVEADAQHAMQAARGQQ